MPRPLLTLVLLLTFGAAAQACPVKAGYIANGMFRDTTGLTPLCAPEYKKLATRVKPGVYAEVYSTTLDIAGAGHILRAIGLFRAQGWTLAKTPNQDGVTSYLLSKDGHLTVITVREGKDSVFVAITGKK